MESPIKFKVYRNLNKKTWSVQSKTKKGWRVLCHSDEIILKDATFIVSKAGRARVIREKRKNVHAYVQGEPLFVRGLTKNTPLPILKFTNKITYNPYKHGTFRNKTINKPIHKAPIVLLSEQGVWS